MYILAMCEGGEHTCNKGVVLCADVRDEHIFDVSKHADVRAGHNFDVETRHAASQNLSVSTDLQGCQTQSAEGAIDSSPARREASAGKESHKFKVPPGTAEELSL